MGNATDLFKDAVIAEIASDVLRIKEDVDQLGPLIQQLKDGLPSHFDLLRTGLIETLDLINEGIKDAGGERIEFVKGQLHVFLEQAIGKAFAENSDKVDKLVTLFERQNNAAALNLKAQYKEVSEGMSQIRLEVEKIRFPTWLKVIIPLAFIVAIGCTGLITWQIASQKEAVYMQAFIKQMDAEK
jgi:hypothetical protein